MALNEYKPGTTFTGVIGRATDESTPAWPQPVRTMPGAGNTPFRRWKRETYRGGASDPFILHWPHGTQARGEVRTQYAHIIGIVPTVLDLLAVEPPAAIRGVTQAPLHGTSFARTLHDADATSPHRTQYFEMFGHRAIDHDGGRAVCPWPGPSFAEAGKPFGTPITAETLDELDAHHGELYHVAGDVAENHDLAGQRPNKLIELITMWYLEAGRYNVLPIDGSAVQRMVTERPQIAQERTSYPFWPGTQTLPTVAAPRVLDLPHSIRADPEIPPEGAEGVLICQGSAAGGWSFYLQDSRLHYAHNYVGRHVYKVSSPDPVGAGGRQLRFEFEPTGEPDVAHGKGARPRPALRGRHPRRPDRHSGHHARHVQSGWDDLRRQPWRAGDTRLPQPVQVHRDLHRVTVDLSGDLIIDAESEMRLATTRQ